MICSPTVNRLRVTASMRAPYFTNDEIFRRESSKTKEADDEELLRWNQALNFGEYSKDWFTTATSLPSDCTFSSMNQSTLSFSQSSVLPKIIIPANPNNYFIMQLKASGPLAKLHYRYPFSVTILTINFCTHDHDS